MAGIYIHIPFCKQACHYCDFHFSTSQQLRERVIKSILLEIKQSKDYLQDSKSSTIYFGGGTPSILTPEELKIILDAINSNFDISSDAELTIECNPDDLNRERLRSFKKLGINRLSIGIQSFRNEDLELMNRAHNSKEALECVGIAQELGFDNITIDLIYGIPGLDFSAWKKNVETAISLRVQHISAYNLTIEHQTAFFHFIKKGKMKDVSEAESIEQYIYLRDRLAEEGFEQYEVSNWCLPNRESKHNSSYWLGEHYLGLGPSAHGFDGKSRRWNIANNPKYCIALEAGEKSYEEELLDRNTRFNEYLLTRLRTKWGIDLEFIQETFDIDFQSMYKTELTVLENEGKLIRKGSAMFLSPLGLLQADGISSGFFMVD